MRVWGNARAAQQNRGEVVSGEKAARAGVDYMRNAIQFSNGPGWGSFNG